MDELDRDLASLAPDVDTNAAWSAFGRRRVSARRRRRVLGGIAAAVGATAGVVGIAALIDQPRDDLQVGVDPDAGGPVEFEVLTVLRGEPIDERLRLVADGSQLSARVPEPLEVDFDVDIVVAIALPDDGCRQLTGFARQGDSIEPVLAVPDAVSCSARSPLAATFVVAIDRSSLGSAARLTVAGDGDTGLASASLDLPSPLAFEVLELREASEPMGRLAYAVTDDDLRILWESIGFDDPPPAVDFAARIVVSITIPDDACPPALAGFQRVGSVLTPLFAEPFGGCEEPLIPKTFVVAIDRAAIGPRATLRLPGQEIYGFGEQRLDLLVDDGAPPPPPAGVAFEVLDMREATEPMGTLRSAVNPDGYAWLWESVGFDGQPPAVDFERRIVVSITMPDDACPPELAGFDREDDLLTPVFAEPAVACNRPLIPKSYVVAIDRAAVAPRFTLRLPGQDGYDFGEQRLTVEVLDRLPASVPPCADITAFADRIGEVGIDYDYSATESPAQLRDRVDIVFSGVLTGGFASSLPGPRQTGEGPGSAYVGFEVSVQSVISPSGLEIPLGRRRLVSIEFNPSGLEPADFEAVAVAGTPVVVFADELAAPGGLVADLEGLATACPGEPPIGRVGDGGAWIGLPSLIALELAAGA